MTPKPSLADIKAWQAAVGATPDGNPGNQTFQKTIEFLRIEGLLDIPTKSDAPQSRNEARKRIVDWALLQEGDRNPDDYWRLVCPTLMGNPHTKAWCGGFALCAWKLNVARCADWNWKDGVGFLYRYEGPKIVSIGEPGDIAYWPTLDGAALHHYAIVKEVVGGFVHSIDGNQGYAPIEKVAQRKRSITDSKPVFYSVGALL